jgi:hypothetical protein
MPKEEGFSTPIRGSLKPSEATLEHGRTTTKERRDR